MTTSSAPRRALHLPRSIMYVAVLAGCGAPPPEASKTLGLLWSGPIPSFLPSSSIDIEVTDFAALVYEGLVGVTPEGRVVPSLAASWSSTDGRRFLFRLRTGVRFHDGSLFNAGAVVAAWRRVLRSPPGSPSHAWQLDLVEGARQYGEGNRDQPLGIQAVDDSTVEVLLSRPFAAFPALLSTTGVAITGPGASDDSVNGTGPWRHRAGRPREKHYLLQRNESHWGHPPRFDSLRILVAGADVEDSVNAGRVDCVPYADGWNGIGLRPDFRLTRSPPGEFLALSLNLRNRWLADRRVREALRLALNVPELARISGLMGIRYAASVLPPATDDPDFRPVHDAPRARGLLREAGLPASTSFAFGVTSLPPSPYVATIRDYLAAVGVTTTVVVTDPNRNDLLDNRIDLQLYRWLPAYPDPDAYLFQLYHTRAAGGLANASGFSDAAVDQAIDEQRSLPDGPERDGAVRRAAALVSEHLPTIPLWFAPLTTGASTRVSHCPSPLYAPHYADVELARP